MGVGEEHATFGQTVDIRGMGLRVTVEAAHPVIQVIDDKEKKIAFGLRKVCGKTEEKNQNRSQSMHPERPTRRLFKLQSNLDRIDFLSRLVCYG